MALKLVDLGSEVDVSLRKATFGVRRQLQRHLVPPDVDVGVMVGGLGALCDGVDEGHGGRKVVTLGHFDDGITLASPVE